MYKLLVMSATLVATAAVAQNPTVTEGTGVNNDPNQIICKREKELGTRLRAQRVCRTRAEWAETKDQTRRSIERAQNQTQTNY